ncbi:cAMP phosphodiesterases class-II-domain-containing protein [Aspergillus californicus]
MVFKKQRKGVVVPPDNEEHGKSDSKPAMHVIVLGPTGGPCEDRVTGILVRSTATEWRPNSMVAVDAGTLIGGIIHVLEQCEIKDGVITLGPFTGLHVPHKSTRANASYIFRKIVGTVLITHAHLDHVSALAMNTPVLGPESGPKAVAALPSVVSAMKAHLFNDVIWPNLSDEDGAGLITYQRLVEGGNPMMGSGEVRGYVRAVDGLLTRCFGVSHGSCKAKAENDHEHFRRASSAIISGDWNRAFTDTPGPPGTRTSSDSPYPGREPRLTTVDSSTFFIHDQQTGSEIMVFGDVEPDSLSNFPRNSNVWRVAAPKIVSHQLRAIFIECSYSDEIEDGYLFGHLCPRHLIAELTVLARFVAGLKKDPASGKRKRGSSGLGDSTEPTSPKSKRGAVSNSSKRKSSSKQSPRRSGKGTDETNEMSDSAQPSGSLDPQALDRELRSAKQDIKDSLSGLAIYIIHIKDDMTDGPPPGERILQELKDRNQEVELGCDFHVPERGESIFI